jgi:hypothetical protein
MMTLQEASVEEDRWSPLEVLIWIATRSRRFMDALSAPAAPSQSFISTCKDRWPKSTHDGIPSLRFIRFIRQRLGSAFVSGCSTAGRYPPALDITDMGWFEEGRQCSRIWHEGPQLEETAVTAGCPAVPPCQAHSVAFQVELLEP